MEENLTRLKTRILILPHERSGGLMSALLIEPILDRYVAQAERREKDWRPKEVETLLLKLRKEVLDCLKSPRSSTG
jgi:hypothetical protein